MNKILEVDPLNLYKNTLEYFRVFPNNCLTSNVRLTSL